MINKKLLISLSFLMLFGCAETKATLDSKINEAVLTASGGIHEASNRIDQAAKPVIDTVNNVQERAGHVKSGWEKFMDAIAEFKAAVGD
jgi:hypothetical protein